MVAGAAFECYRGLPARLPERKDGSHRRIVIQMVRRWDRVRSGLGSYSQVWGRMHMQS